MILSPLDLVKILNFSLFTMLLLYFVFQISVVKITFQEIFSGDTTILPQHSQLAKSN